MYDLVQTIQILTPEEVDFVNKEIDTTYVCNACGGSGHSGARTKL